MQIYIGFSAAFHQLENAQRARTLKFRHGDLIISRISLPGHVAARANAWFEVDFPFDDSKYADATERAAMQHRVRDAFMRATGFRLDEGAPPLKLNWDRLRARVPGQAALITAMLNTSPKLTPQEKTVSDLMYKITVVEKRLPTPAEQAQIDAVPLPYRIPKVTVDDLLDCMEPAFVEERAAAKESTAQAAEISGQKVADECETRAKENEALIAQLGDATPLCAATCAKLRKDADELRTKAAEELIRRRAQADERRGEKSRLLEKVTAQKQRYERNG